MPHATWLLQDSAARVELDSFTAKVDLHRPQRGLAGIQWREQALAGHEILAVELAPHDAQSEETQSEETQSEETPSDETLPAETPVDCYQRLGDLVATYEQTPRRPMRVQIYWRAAAFELGPRQFPGVELQVSVQTSLLDSQPQLTSSSTLPLCEVRRLVNASSCTFVACSPQGTSALSLSPQQGPGCLLFRWPQSGVSYVEMIDPSDFGRDELAPSAAGRLKLSHRLFVSPLEKGVILRARLRGVYLPCEGDERNAAEAYRAFLDSPPPLTA